MRQIDVRKQADEARFNGFHGLVLFWCALIIIFDGYDLAVADIALPSIMKEMGVDPTQAGPIAIAIPAVIGMVAVLMIQHGRSASAHHEDVSAEIPDPPARVSVAG